MNAQEIRKAYLEFCQKNGHEVIQQLFSRGVECNRSYRIFWAKNIQRVCD